MIFQAGQSLLRLRCVHGLAADFGATVDGLRNFQTMFLEDNLFGQAMRVTTTYALLAVPLQIAFGLFVATLLNHKVVFLSFIRTVYYLPVV